MIRIQKTNKTKVFSAGLATWREITWVIQIERGRMRFALTRNLRGGLSKDGVIQIESGRIEVRPYKEFLWWFVE